MLQLSVNYFDFFLNSNIWVPTAPICLPCGYGRLCKQEQGNYLLFYLIFRCMYFKVIIQKLDFFNHKFMYILDFTVLPKGQLISKADWRAIDSPKKWTDEFVLFAFLLFTANKSNSSVHFLGESTARQSGFRN